MMEISEVLWLHFGVTAYMVGVIAVVQAVHYPLFSWVDRERYTEFQLEHMRRITWVVGPPMILEAMLALGLVLVGHPEVSQELATAGLVLLGIVWGSTALQQVPAHNRLMASFDEAAHRKLVRSNWVRTTAWSARLLVAWALL